MDDCLRARPARAHMGVHRSMSLDFRLRNLCTAGMLLALALCNANAASIDITPSGDLRAAIAALRRSNRSATVDSTRSNCDIVNRLREESSLRLNLRLNSMGARMLSEIPVANGSVGQFGGVTSARLPGNTWNEIEGTPFHLRRDA